MAREPTARRPNPKPLTIDHWRRWARLLVLDSQDLWVPEPFQDEVVAEILAGVREVWLDVPEGNGKSTLLSGVALYHAGYTFEASVPIAARSREQAQILLHQAAGFVRRTPGLERRYRIQEGYRRIIAYKTRGRIQVYAADSDTADGVIFTLAMLDELHRHPDLELYRTWHGKIEKRSAQICAISTAGEPGSEYEDTKASATKKCRVERRGAHTVARKDNFVLHQHALKPADDLRDVKLVKRANPFSGVTEKSLGEALGSPSFKLSHWARFKCGVPMRTEGSAIEPEEWGRQPERELPAGQGIWCGLDLGWKWDTTAAVPLWIPEDEDLNVFGVPEVIVPPRDGTSTPPRKVREALRRLHQRNPIHTVVLDPNAGGEQLVEWIERPPLDPDDDRELSDEERDVLDGLGAETIAYSQSNEPQAVAYERWMEELRSDRLAHPHDDTFTEQVLNAVAKPVLNSRHRFDRPSSTRGAAKKQKRRVIDCLQAGSAVLVSASATPEDESIDVSDFRIESL